MIVTLRPAPFAEKSIVISLFNYYLYEFSDILSRNLPEHGSYLNNTDLIDPYWSIPDHTPYFIEADGNIAGFVFVRHYPTETSVYDIDQFFILKRYARLGVGSRAFQLCVDLHPGNWLIRVLPQNHRGLAFWQKAVAAVSQGQFTQGYELDLGVEMHFLRFTTRL